MAKAAGRDLPISAKHSREVCRFIRGKGLQRVKKELAEVIKGKRAVPYGKYNQELSHKKGMGAGRFPKKTCQEILGLLESVEKNAQFKGLNTAQLEIVHICSHRGARPWHYGRQRGRKMKRANVEVIVRERKKKEEVKKGERKKVMKKKEKKKLREKKKEGSDKK